MSKSGEDAIIRLTVGLGTTVAATVFARTVSTLNLGLSASFSA